MEATVPLSALPSILGAAAGKSIPRRVVSAPLAYTATLDDSGALILCAADNSVVTLPLAADNKGLVIRVANAAAAAAAKVSISPNALDKIVGTVGAVQSGGVLDKDWINTKATTKQGDYTELTSDGGTTWWITGGVGVWVSEA